MIKPHERRKYPRLRLEERAVVRKLGDGDGDAESSKATLYCSTIDISPNGLQIRLNKNLATGDNVDVVIQVEGYGDFFHLVGKVMWCVSLRGVDDYLVGVELRNTDDVDFAYWRRIFN